MPSRISRIHIDNDDGVARAILAPGTDTRRALMARLNLVGIQYRRLARQELYDPGSPFADKDQDSVLDPSNFHTSVSPDMTEIIIEVRAPAAGYVEEGNDGAEADPGQYLGLPLKSSAVRRRRSRRGRIRKGFELRSGGGFVVRHGGRYLLLTRRVNAAPGRHLLRRAVDSVFR